MKPGDMAAPEFQELLRERAAARLRGQPVPNRYEVRIFTKDGRERWFDITSAYIAIDDGEPVALATAVDITERKLGEERLRAIVEGTSSTTGADFLRSLVRHLAGALGMEYAFISEVGDDDGHPRPPARPLGDRRLQRAVRVRPPRHPLRARRRPPDLSFHPSGVWQLFPDDRWLVDDPDRELHRRAAVRPRRPAARAHGGDEHLAGRRGRAGAVDPQDLRRPRRRRDRAQAHRGGARPGEGAAPR